MKYKLTLLLHPATTVFSTHRTENNGSMLCPIQVRNIIILQFSD